MRSSCSPSPGGELRVTHVLEAYGGVETYLRLLLDHWQDDDVRFSFVLGHDNSFAAELRERGHTVAVVPMPRTRSQLSGLASARRLRGVIRELAPDVVHLHSSQAGFVGRLACIGSSSRVVYTPHAFYYLGMTGARRRLFMTAERVLARLCPTQVLATSPSEAHRAVTDVGVPDRRVSTLLNAVEISGTAFRPRPVAGPLRVGMVGRVCPQKGLETFVGAAASLARSRPSDFEFHLVGVGHYVGDDAVLESLCDRAGMDSSDLHRRAWLPRPQVLEWMCGCDVIVLSSRFESFGYALAEAGACGVAAVGTDTDGIRDVVEDGVSGLLFPVDDADALARLLIRLADDRELTARLGAGGRRVVSERMDINGFVRDLDDYYRRLLDQQGVRSDRPRSGAIA